MSLKKKKQLLNGFLAIVCVAVIACVLSGNKALCIASLGLGVVYGLVHSTIWRCPQCGGSLGRGKPNHCPHCDREMEY